MLSTWRIRTIGNAAVLSAVAVTATSCTGAAAHPLPGNDRLTAVTRPPGATAALLAGAPEAAAVAAARQLFASAPVVVVADASRPAELAIAAARALHAHAPLLLMASSGSVTPPAAARGGLGASGADGALRAEVDALDPRAVLDVGLAVSALSARLPGIRIVTTPAALPATAAPARLRHVVLLVRRGDHRAATIAAVTTARAAGATVVAVSGFDPRADPAAIRALRAAAPRQVLAAGSGFWPARRLAARVLVAATGVQLPGGGQVLFPAHRLVALYGYPGTAALGALGEQGLAASIARVRRLAAVYRPLSGVPVVPAFEIIATVAQSSPGRDGAYSFESPAASLRPWVRRATADGMYVVLDLQPGRAGLLGQARRYRSLLRLPDVGLALDAEWKLQPGQLPLRQIGSVSIAEVNSVIGWLARLTARYRLPQKLLVLHQFRLSMIAGEQHLDTRHDDLAIVIHMDGQGTPDEKRQTWDAVTGAAPAGVFFGWKNFFAKDHPMLSATQTMTRSPQPVMISYQ